jgi:cardiolipin synthase
VAELCQDAPVLAVPVCVAGTRHHWPTHHRILAAVLVVAIAIVGGLLFAQDQETLRITSSYSAADEAFPDYLAHLLGHALTAGDGYVVHTNAADAFPAMLASIAGARTRVDLETYIFEPGEAGERFTAALVKAARRGVRVRLVLDAIGSKTFPADFRDRLQAAGCRIGWVNPVRSIETINYRTHRKALIVDGDVAFVGGMGIGDNWIRTVDGRSAWRDTQIEMHGPAVADVEAGFDQNWILTGGIVDPRIPLAEPHAGRAQSVVVWSAPQGGVSGMKLLYLLAIAAARREIDVESPYLVLDSSSRWAIREARRRGVRIRMVLDGDRTDARIVKYASRAQYETLLEEGVDLNEYQPTMMHAKTMVVDGVLSIVGSANFDNRSLELNDELNVAVFDAALAARLRQDFDRDVGQSKRMTLAAWQSRPLLTRGRDWIWSLGGELF